MLVEILFRTDEQHIEVVFNVFIGVYSNTGSMLQENFNDHMIFKKHCDVKRRQSIVIQCVYMLFAIRFQDIFQRLNLIVFDAFK